MDPPAVQREDVLQLERLFNARLAPIALAKIVPRPLLSFGEWRPGAFAAALPPGADENGASTSALVSSDTESYETTKQFLDDLDLLVAKAYARVLWEVKNQQLYLSVYLVPHDLPNLRKSGVQPVTLRRERSALRAALRRLYNQFLVHDEPLLHQVRASGTLLHAWNAVPSPSSRANLEGLEDGDAWLKEKVHQLYSEDKPFNLTKSLYPYQRNDVAAMLAAEGLPRKADDLTFTRITDELGERFWVNVDFQLRKRVGRYQLPTGGILANMPGSGKSLELLALISATKNRPAPVHTEATGYGPFTPKLCSGFEEDWYRGGSSEEDQTIAPGPPSLVESCARLIRERVALPQEAVERISCTTAAGPLANTLIHFERPPAELFEDLSEPTKRSSERINENFHARSLDDFETDSIFVSKTSLLVVPNNLLQHWQDEIQSSVEDACSYEDACHEFDGATMWDWSAEEHLWAERQFLWIVIKDEDHKRGLGLTEQQLSRFDLILMSNLTFQKQPIDDVTRKDGLILKSPLCFLHYMRVAFDEAVFSTGSDKSRGAILANRLSSHARWTISATPTKNLTQNHEDLQAVDRPLDETLRNKQDESDLERLGRAAAFLKMLPFSSDKSLFRHWITQAFVQGYGYASAAAFLNQVIVRTHPERIRLSMSLPPLETRVEVVEWGYFDRLSYNAIRALFCANSIFTEKQGNQYLFSARNQEQRNTLLSNVHESHTAIFQPDLLESAQGALRNVEDAMSKESISAEKKIELQPVLLALKEACDSRLWVQACQSYDLCYLVQGLSPTISHCYDVQATYLGQSDRAPSETVLLSAVRMSDLLTALDGVQRVPSAEQGSWQTGEELDEEMATQGLKQLAEKHAAKQKPKKPVKKVEFSLDPKSPQKQRKKTAPKQKQSKNTKRQPPKKIHPLRRLPPDSSLHGSQILASTSGKVNFVVEQIVGSAEDDFFIIFSEQVLALYNVATALRFRGVSCAYNYEAKAAERSAYIQEFKEPGGPKVLLITPREGGRGLHLTRANRIMFLSPTWQKDDEAQATLRSHRIGQTRPVLVQILVMKDSFEKDLLKRRNQLIDGQQNAQAQQQHLKSEADDQELRSKLEQATFIRPTPGEEDLKNLRRWTSSRPLVTGVRRPGSERTGAGDDREANRSVASGPPEPREPTPDTTTRQTSPVPSILPGLGQETDIWESDGSFQTISESPEPDSQQTSSIAEAEEASTGFMFQIWGRVSASSLAGAFRTAFRGVKRERDYDEDESEEPSIDQTIARPGTSRRPANAPRKAVRFA